MRFPYLLFWLVVGIISALIALPAEQGSSAADLEAAALRAICYVVAGSCIGIFVGILNELWDRPQS